MTPRYLSINAFIRSCARACVYLQWKNLKAARRQSLEDSATSSALVVPVPSLDKEGGRRHRPWKLLDVVKRWKLLRAELQLSVKNLLPMGLL